MEKCIILQSTSLIMVVVMVWGGGVCFQGSWEATADGRMEERGIKETQTVTSSKFPPQ